MGFYEEKLVPVIKAVCAVIEQTEHMQDILHGTMSEERFRFQILQNHQYLLDYTRCWAVAFSKCTCFQEMEDWYPLLFYWTNRMMYLLDDRWPPPYLRSSH